MKIFRAIFLTTVACGGCLTVHAQAVNGMKAVVHDSVITFQEVEVLTASTADLLRRQYRTEPEVYQKKVVEALGDNLDQLVERQLILHEFQTAGYNLPESYIDEIVQDRIRARYGDRASLTKSLQAQGMTYEKFRLQVRDQYVIEALRAKNVSSEIMISPQKLANYYNEHSDGYQVEDRVKLRMIVLNKPAGGDAAEAHQRADEVLSKIKAGASFAEMASVNSEGSQSKQGGDWGWVERSTLFRGLSEVAFEMNAGQVSGVLGRAGGGKDYWFYRYTDAGQLATARHFVLDEISKKENLIEEKQFSNGTNSIESVPQPDEFYLMLVEEKKPAHVKPLNEVRDEIERTMLGQERARLEKQWVARLKKKTFVRYF